MSDEQPECNSVVKLHNDDREEYYTHVYYDRDDNLSLDEIRDRANEKTDDEWYPVKVRETYTWDSARECYV